MIIAIFIGKTLRENTYFHMHLHQFHLPQWPNISRRPTAIASSTDHYTAAYTVNMTFTYSMISGYYQTLSDDDQRWIKCTMLKT
jgi:hypothetical protein